VDLLVNSALLRFWVGKSRCQLNKLIVIFIVGVN